MMMYFLFGPAPAAQKLVDAIKEVWKSVCGHMCCFFKFTTGVPYINPIGATTIFPQIHSNCEYSSK
jgi:hypothetical protein